MKLRDKKGSISIFVLVMLLFMSAFLLILYASNVSKSKTIKEQFNIISDIYAYSEGDEGAYDKAYTDLRNKNKQTMTASSENSSILELTKTFNENMGNLKIYGNSVQDTTNGDPSPSNPVEIQSVGYTNLFDINNSLGFTSQYTGITNTIEDNTITITCSISARGGKLDLGTYEAGTYYMSAKYINGFNSGCNILLNEVNSNKNLTNEGMILTISETTKIELYYAFSNTVDYYQVSEIQVVKSNKQLDYIPYGKYCIPVKARRDQFI